MILLAFASIMTAPLSITAEAAKPRTLVGEDIVIHLHQQANSSLELEAIERNLDRTQIRLTTLADGKAVVLSGRDAMRLHQLSPLADFGRSFSAKAGESWSSDLNLLQYTRPPAAGRYRVEITYRYGSNGDAVARANAVEVEVTPAKLLTVAYQWFGPPAQRSDLGSVWTAQNAKKVRWFFQTATPQNPSAVLTATEFRQTESAPPSAPVLAHLNDFAAMHYDRFAVWQEGGRVCWDAVHAGGQLTHPVCTEHGLVDTKLADPPLERRDGGLGLVLTGPNVAVVIDAGVDTKIRTRRVALSATPQRSVVFWDNSTGEAASALYWIAPSGLFLTNLATGDEKRVLDGVMDSNGLTIEQWLGTGMVAAVIRDQQAMRSILVDARTNQIERGVRADGGELMDLTPSALLLRNADAWHIVTKSGPSAVQVPEAGASELHLASSPMGLFVLGHSETHGFFAVKAGDQKP
jgi:hypothetical protein